MPIRIEITGENADHAWAELKGLAAPAFAQPLIKQFTWDGKQADASEVGPAAGETGQTEDARDASVSLAEATQEAATPEPTKRTRRKKDAEPSAAQPVDLKALEAQKAAEPAPLISTQPEDRQDRADPVVADEPEAAAELAPAPEEAKPATKDDVRNALTDYQALFGVAATQADGPKLLGAPKLSELAEADYEAAVANIRAAIHDNPYGRAPVKAGA